MIAVEVQSSPLGFAAKKQANRLVCFESENKNFIKKTTWLYTDVSIC